MCWRLIPHLRLTDSRRRALFSDLDSFEAGSIALTDPGQLLHILRANYSKWKSKAWPHLDVPNLWFGCPNFWHTDDQARNHQAVLIESHRVG